MVDLSWKKEKLKSKIKNVIRGKALFRLSKKGVNFSKEIEILLKEEERKILKEYKSNSVFVLATLLGISLF